MSVEPTIDALSPPTAHANARRERNASLALLLATVFWGCGFTWAKAGGEAIQAAARVGSHSPFGPIFLLAWRFTVGGVAWLLMFPAARRGWSMKSVVRLSGVGVILGVALVVQHVGLDWTTEAVSAFLTSLTILFVPILTTVVFRKPPRAVLWLGVALATLGVWKMTAAEPRGFGRGELLGVGCAVGFSIYILAVNAASTHETSWRSTAGQFLAVGLVCFIASAIWGGADKLAPSTMARILSVREVWLNTALMAIFPTLTSFGLLTHFQPRIDPTRAALIYLVEPIFATIYALAQAGHRPTRNVAIGAVLILAANVLVELISSRKKTPAAFESAE